MRVAILGIILSLGAGFAQPVVMTTLYPYYALVTELVGDKAEVELFLPPGASPHTFDPSPREVARLAQADLFVYNGGLDAWTLDFLDSSGSRAERFEVMSAVEFEALEADDHSEDATGVNPHIWLDPVLMIGLVPVLVEELGAIDPANRRMYEENGQRLRAELQALHGELESLFAGLQGAAFVPFHDAWPYFARRYGLDLVVEIEPSPGREPSARYLAEALELIGGSGAKAIFAEAQLPKRPAEIVARAAGVDLYVLDPVGGGPETLSYAELLRYNAGQIALALGN